MTVPPEPGPSRPGILECGLGTADLIKENDVSICTHGPLLA